MRKPVLQVEDSSDDAKLLELAFRNAGVTNEIITVESGEEALNYLKGIGPYWDRDAFPLPGVVMVDLKLPGASGFEVMEWIKARQEPADILVVAITGHNDLENIKRAYTAGAGSFLAKPINQEDVLNLARGFRKYWSIDRLNLRMMAK